MNPKEQEHAPSFELPPAQPSERKEQALSEGQYAARNERQGNIAVEHGVSHQSAPSAPPSALSPQQGGYSQATMPDPAAQPVGSLSAGAPPIAEDADLIEKEWVIKAKEIVAQTAHDPHLQNKEINRFKADYLKKRYNKEIKLSED